jgi:hypothetical protein
VTILLSACVSTFGPQIGMTEKQWLRRTLIVDVAYMEGSVKAYRSGNYYYYFSNGVLAKVDQGMIPAHRIEMDIRSNSNVTRSSSGGLYGELSQLDRLRKEGLITDQEFQMRKQKVLNR